MQLKLWRLGAGAMCGVIMWAAAGCTDPPVATRPLRGLAYDAYSGPTTGFRTVVRADGAPTTASFTVLAKNRSDFDFRIRMVAPNDVLFPACPDPCPPQLSRDQPSLHTGDGFPLGTFPGGTLVSFIVLACRPDYVELCFIANTPPIGGSTTLGWINFGSSVSPNNFDFNDFVIRVTLTPVPPPDTLKVTVAVRRDSIRPVMAPCFDAVAQTAYNVIPRPLRLPNQDPCDPTGQRGTHVSRTDNAQVTIHAFFAPSGRPAAGGSVTLTVAPRDSSGGHAHGIGAARPKGTFFLAGEDISRDGRDTARVGQIALTLSATGDAQPVYRTSGVSGSEVLTVRVQAEGRVVVATDSVVVAVPGLVELTEGGSVDTIGLTTSHPDSHWGAPAMAAAVRQLADSVSAFASRIAALPFQARPSGRFPSQLGVNDMSLRLGGLFDVDSTWTFPHVDHRDGFDADIDVRRETSDDNYARLVRAVWMAKLGHELLNERRLHNHYHLMF
jgi:hypothetical protein